MDKNYGYGSNMGKNMGKNMEKQPWLWVKNETHKLFLSILCVDRAYTLRCGIYFDPSYPDGKN
jgi:hypothetical protein